MEWHYEVHHRFGEQLVYYLLRVRPFEAEAVYENLCKLLAKHELESIRVFKIFGPNDLLIRAWLHSNVSPTFPEWLRDALVFGTEVRPFYVTRLHLISSLAPQLDLPESSDLLDSLYDQDTIREVQEGHDENMLNKLIQSNIVFTRDQDGPDPIKFFLAMALSQKDEAIQKDAARVVCDHILRDMPSVNKVSVYGGVGFCDILIKGEVVGEHFFSIGELIDWIYQHLRQYNATTETHVVAWPRPLVEAPDKISDSTFKAIHGRDPFVQTIIPELYEKFYSMRKEIEAVIFRSSKQVVASYRKLVHEYLLGYLEGKNPEMGKVLFTFFTELEEYLRENHAEFIGRNGLPVGKVYDAVSVPQGSRQYVTLGHLLNICAYVVKTKHLTNDSTLMGDWNGLAELRNKSLHGNFNYKEEWSKSLEVLLQYLPRVESLIEIIHTCTGKQYNFTFLLLR